MSILVEQQDEQITVINDTVKDVEKDVETGYVWFAVYSHNHIYLSTSLNYTNKAVDSARAARKKRWICFMIFLVLLIVIAIVVVVFVLKNKPSSK